MTNSIIEIVEERQVIEIVDENTIEIINQNNIIEISDIKQSIEVLDQTTTLEIITEQQIIEIVESTNSSGSSFLQNPIVDLNSPTYYYYGGEISSWKINRILKTDINVLESADIGTNASFTSLSNAWTNRTSLVYT